MIGQMFRLVYGVVSVLLLLPRCLKAQIGLPLTQNSLVVVSTSPMQLVLLKHPDEAVPSTTYDLPVDFNPRDVYLDLTSASILLLSELDCLVYKGDLTSPSGSLKPVHLVRIVADCPSEIGADFTAGVIFFMYGQLGIITVVTYYQQQQLQPEAVTVSIGRPIMNLQLNPLTRQVFWQAASGGIWSSSYSGQNLVKINQQPLSPAAAFQFDLSSGSIYVCNPETDSFHSLTANEHEWTQTEFGHKCFLSDTLSSTAPSFASESSKIFHTSSEKETTTTLETTTFLNVEDVKSTTGSLSAVSNEVSNLEFTSESLPNDKHTSSNILTSVQDPYSNSSVENEMESNDASGLAGNNKISDTVTASILQDSTDTLPRQRCIFAVDKDEIYYYSRQKRLLMRCNRTSEKTTAYKSTPPDGLQLIASTKTLFSDYLKLSGLKPKNDCIEARSSCKDVCIPLSNQDPGCLCPMGWFSAGGDADCVPVSGIYSISRENSVPAIIITGPDNMKLAVLKSTHLHGATAFVRNIHGDFIVAVNRTIMMLPATAPNRTTQLYNSTSGQVSSMVYDSDLDLVYWVDFLYGWVMVVNTQTRKVAVVTDMELVYPRQIVFHPQQGQLYVLDVYGVMSFHSNGMGRKKLIQLSSPSVSSSMALDMSSNRLYMLVGSRLSSWDTQGDGYMQQSIAVHLSNHTDLQNSSLKLLGVSKKRLLLNIDGVVLSLPVDNVSATEGHPTVPGQLPTLLSPFSSTPSTNKELCVAKACQHLCTAGKAGDQVFCMCGIGENLMADHTTCQTDVKRTHQHHYAFTFGGTICSVPVTVLADPETFNRQQHCFYNVPGLELRGLGALYEEASLFVGENRHYETSIRRIRLLNRRDSRQLNGPGKVEYVTVDHASKLIVWSDSQLDQLWMSRVSGLYPTILVPAIQDPAGIVVDPRFGHIYAVEQSYNKKNADLQTSSDVVSETKTASNSSRSQHVKNSARIVRIRLRDGSTETVLDTNLTKPHGIDLDFTEDRLYWADGNRIGSSNLNGSDLKLIFPEINGHIFDVDIYRGFLVVTVQSATSCIYTLNKKTGEVFSHLCGMSTYKIWDGVVYAPDVQPHVETGCSKDFGGCSQLCVSLGRGQHRCACVDGMVLQSDGTTCKPVLTKEPEGDFFLLADDYRNEVYIATPDFNSISAIPLLPRVRPVALTYDWKRKMVYFTDFWFASLFRCRLDGSEMTNLWQYGKERGRIDGLSVEPEAGLIYYSDVRRNFIGVTDLDARYHKRLITGNPSPRSIQLDPSAGKIYYTSRNPPSVIEANLSGTFKRTIVSGGLIFPNGIILDKTANKIFVVDRETEKIEQSDLTGTSRKLLHHITGFPDPDPFSLTKRGQYLYWSDWRMKGLGRINIGDPNDLDHIGKQYFLGLNEIVYVSQQKLGPNACSVGNGGCSHFCIPMPTGTRLCMCPDNMQNVSEYQCASVSVSATVPTGKKQYPDGPTRQPAAGMVTMKSFSAADVTEKIDGNMNNKYNSISSSSTIAFNMSWLNQETVLKPDGTPGTATMTLIFIVLGSVAAAAAVIGFILLIKHKISARRIHSPRVSPWRLYEVQGSRPSSVRSLHTQHSMTSQTSYHTQISVDSGISVVSSGLQRSWSRSHSGKPFNSDDDCSGTESLLASPFFSHIGFDQMQLADQDVAQPAMVRRQSCDSGGSAEEIKMSSEDSICVDA